MLIHVSKTGDEERYCMKMHWNSSWLIENKSDFWKHSAGFSKIVNPRNKPDTVGLWQANVNLP